MNNRKRLIAIATMSIALVTIGAPQFGQILKLVGVGAAVKQFGPEMNRAMNKLTNHTDTEEEATKVVPILTVGIGKSSGIGAAQVTGPKSAIAKVEAVAAPETELFGKEVRIRGLIPVSSKDVVKNIKKVEGVGVTGIIDFKL